MGVSRRQLSKGKITIIAIISLLAALNILIQGDDVITTSSINKFKVEQIIIDAGHGGVDPGATGVGGETEKDINLSIALKLECMLKINGFNTIMIREEDISIHDDEAVTVREQKVSDLRNRLEITNENPNSITVSIHQNVYQQSNQTGAQMFYGANNPLSESLATCLQNAFIINLQPDNTREIKEATKSVYLINNATTPIVLAECGFLSNAEEAALLSQESYQTHVAFTLFYGIIEFINETENSTKILEE